MAHVSVNVVKSVTLEMSEIEARTLSMILARVGGDPRLSPREYVENISYQLAQNDIKNLKPDFNDDIGRIQLPDYSSGIYDV